MRIPSLAHVALALLLATACNDHTPTDAPPRQAHLQALVATGAVGMPLRFQCSAMDAETALLAYAFDWGDGSAPTGAIITATQTGTPVEVEHAYAQPGEFEVRCRAEDGSGQAGPWSAPARVHVRASPSGPMLTVARVGEGSVRSVPEGIDCGTSCEAFYTEDTWVRLEATPAVGWRFSRWEGTCDGTGSGVQVLLRGDVRCVARFEQKPTSFLLTVEVVGEGDVTSLPAAIQCPGPTCLMYFADAEQVTLRAAPRAGWRFYGWAGDCASPDREVQFEHVKTRKCVARFVPDVRLALDWQRIGADGTAGLAWSPDGSLLASVDSGAAGMLRVWDARTADVRHVSQRFDLRYVSLAWSGAKRLVATGMSNGRVLVLDPSTWQTVHALSGHTQYVAAVAWSADGTRLVSVDGSGSVRLWDTSTWAVVGQRTAGAGVRRMSLSADGRWLGVEVSGTPDLVELHDLESEQVTRLPGRSLAWSPRGDRFAVRVDAEVRIFVPGEAEPRTVLTSSASSTSALDWSPDGRWLVVGDREQRLLVLDADSGAVVARVPGITSSGGLRDVRFHPSLPVFAAASSYPLEISVFTVDAASGTASRLELTAHERPIRVAAWSPAGDVLATGSTDGNVRLWGARGEPLHELVVDGNAFNSSAVNSLSWDAAGRRFATATDDGAVRLWNADGTPAGFPWQHGDEARQVALSPDGSRLAAVGYRYSPETLAFEYGWVSVWDTATGARLAYFHETSSTPWDMTAEAMTWSPDGSQLLVAWRNQTWTRWRAATGERTRVTAKEGLQLTGGAAFSPDARRLVTWGPNETSIIWDVESGARIASLGGGEWPDSFAWSPDGRFVSGGTSRGRLLIWDTGLGMAVFNESRAHEDWLDGMSWHPDGHHLTTVGWDLRVMNWRVTW